MGDEEHLVRTEKWDRVTIKWDLFSGLGTSVHADGHFDPKLYDPKVGTIGRKLHGLFGMEAVSLYSERDSQRRGEMTLEIGRLDANYPPHSKALVKLLEAEFARRKDTRGFFSYAPRVKGPETVSWADKKFVIGFVLANDEHFCDLAIELGRAVMEGLGSHDETGLYLARFSVTRETFVRLDGAWITFARWLRMSHRLPILGPEDPL